MNSQIIPAINRKFPRLLYYVNIAVMYLTTLPANWLLAKLGFGPVMLRMTMKISEGRKGGRKAFRGYTPVASDIVVSTFAKSGTNWMLQMVHQIVFHGAGEYAHIHDVVPWPDMKGGIIKCIPLENPLVAQLSVEHKRVIKTHLPAQFVPYNPTAHYLTVVRDPKEVFVSSYYFCLGTHGPLMPDFATWFKLFFTADFPMNFGGTWAEHTAGWWALRQRPNVQVLLFKDMKQDLQGTVQRVADKLGATLSAAELAQVVEKSGFAYMKTIDGKFLPMPKENLPWGRHQHMMREGRHGNSGELLTAEQQRQIDTHCRAELARLGSDFPYAELFMQQPA